MIEAKKSARNKLQKMERKEQHYSFRKVNTGLASVLLGFTLGGLAISFTPGKVAAADTTPAQVTTPQSSTAESIAATGSQSSNDSTRSTSTSTQATTSTNNTTATTTASNTGTNTATTTDAPSSQTETVSTQVKTQVSYTGSNQNPATQETKTTFSGKKTGDSSYDWTNKSATVTTTVPVVSGYVANTDQVTQKVSANSDGSFTGSDNITGKSSTVSNDTYTSQVTYKAVGRIVPVDKNGNEITADIKGNYVAPVAYSNTTRADQVVATAAPTIDGYILADSANETITPSSATEDTKVIYLLVTTTKGVKQVVTYTGAGSKTPAKNSQTITFSKTTSRSSDGKTTTSDWDKKDATFGPVTVPTIEGYTADVTTVAGQTVTANSDDIHVPVTYTANEAKATVNFKDDDASDPQDLSAKSISLTGKTDKSIDFTTAEDQVKKLLAAGYELSQTNDAVIDPATGKFKVTSYDTSDDASTVSQVFTIHLKHKTTTTTTSKKFTRTINYQSTASGFTAPSSQTQTASFTEEKVTDDVTGKTLSDSWMPDTATWEKVTTPEVTGYVADQASVSEKDVTKDSEDEKTIKVNYYKIGQITSQKGTSQTNLTYSQDATSASFTVPVEVGYTATLNGKPVSQGSTITLAGADAAVDQTLLYTANAQSATVAFVDDQGQTLYTSSLTGQTDGNVDFTSANEVLAKFIAAGYQVSSNNPNLTESEFTAATYTANGGQSFTAYLTHPEKTVSLTASYQDASGNKLADDQTKSVTFTGLGEFDKDSDVVTVTWTAKDGDAELANPVITGYVSLAAKATISSSATGDISQPVVYRAVGKLNAVDKNGKLLASLAYANNPADASQVIVNLPTVADYTATQTSVTVSDPTKDTDLLYVPSTQTKVFTQKVTFSGAGAKSPAEQSETIIFVKNGDSWKQTSGPANGTFSFTIPEITGYSKSVSGEAATVTPDTDSVSDITVTYTPLAQKATVTFVDDDKSDAAKQTLTTVNLTGQTDAAIDFAAAKKQLASYEAAGYVLADGSSLPGGAVYDDDTATAQAYTVHLKHGKTVLTSNDLSSLSAATKAKISAESLTILQDSKSYSENKSASRTVKYGFSSTNSTDLPSVAEQTDSVTFSRPITYTVDQVTGAVTKSEGNWTVTTGQADISAVTPQTISGWYLADAANGDYLKEETLKPGDSQIVTLTYKRLQKAAIQVIDGDDSDKVLDNYSQTGEQGAAINFKQIDEQTTLTTKDASGNESTVTINSVSDANAQLNAYIKAGYVLDTTDATTSQVDAQTVRYKLANGAIIDVVSDEQGNKTYVWANSFDSDDTVDQTITLKLLHGTTTQTKNKTVTRKITINPVKGDSYTTKQTVNLTETIITDNVTGETTSDTWTTGTWAAYDVPTEIGYDASVTSIPKVDVTDATSDADIVVNYLPKAASATIKIIDDDAGNVELNEYLVSGTTAGQINFTNAIKQLTSYLDGNYVFASSNNSKIVIAYNKDGNLSSITAEDIYEGSNASQNYEIHLKHKTKTGTIYSSVNRTISFQLPTGTQTLVQKVVLTCSTVTDLVTGSRSDGAWKATGSWSAETVPEVTGYTPSETSIEAESVNVETPDKAITVVYTPDVEHVQVNIIDVTTGKILAEADLTGDYGTSVDFDKPAKSMGNVSPNGKLQSYLANGYVLSDKNNSAVDVAASPVVFNAANYGTQGVTLEAHLVQGIKETTESATSTRTIQYIISGEDKLFTTLDQEVKVTRTKKVNQVTGETTYTDWTTGTWVEAISPTHVTDPTDVPDGYYPDKATVAEQTGISKNTGDQVVLVLYSKTGDGISGTVQIRDESKSTSTNLYSVQINGKSGNSVDFSAANTRLTDYLKQGYVADTTKTLLNQAINEAGTAFAEKKYTTNGQNFIVYLTHGIDVQDPQTKSITRTVNYSFPNGTTKTFVQAVNYTRTVSLDKVTDKTSYGDWTLANSTTTVSVNGAAATKTEGDAVATWAALDTATVAKDAGIDTTGYKASLDSVEAVNNIGTDTTSQVINISFPAIVEKARIVFLDSSSSAPTKDASGQTITPEFTYASSYDGQTAGVYKNAIDFSHANLYLKDLLQQGYEIGVDDFVNPNSGSYMAQLTKTNTVTAADGTVTETRLYTPAATGAETITETITTSPSTMENGQTKQVVKYAFVQGDKSGEITATTTTVDGTSTTVYSLSDDTFAATDKTFLFFLKHGRTHYSYDPDKSNNNASTYKDTTRTIHYHLPDGSTLTRLQTVRMTRTTDIDRVTGGVIYTPWTTGESNYSWIVQSLTDKDGKLLSTGQEKAVRSSDWSLQASPDEDNTIVISGKTTVGNVVKGYTATRASVDAKTVNSSTPNSVVDISYKADHQAADIQIIDDTTKTVLSEFNPSGVTAGKIDFTAANSSLNYYLQHGYLLATGDSIDNSAVSTTDGVTSFIAANFDNEDNTDQKFVVYLVHDTATTDKAIDKTATTITDKDGNTIGYVTPVVDNPKVTNPASYTQTVTSVRTVKYVFSGDSSSKPKVADFVQKVTWTRNVSFNIDLVTGKETPIYTDWTYVASGPNAQAGQDASSTSDDQVTLTPVTLTDDEVKQGFIGIVSGEFSGWYLVSSAANAGKQLLKALDNGSAINENVVLEYRRYADATIQIIDDTTGKVLKDDKITGYSQNGKQGTQIDFTQANTDLADYLAHGYALASDGNSQLTGNAFTATAFDNKDNETQTFAAHLIHDTATVANTLTTDSQITAKSGRTAYLGNALTNTTLTDAASYSEQATSTRKVTFAFKSNAALPTGVTDVNGKTVTQTVTYTRPIVYTVDLVNGKATRDYEAWNSATTGTSGAGTMTKIDENGKVSQSAESSFTDAVFPAVTGTVSGWYLDSGDASSAAAQTPGTDKVGNENNKVTYVTLTFKKLQNAYVKIIDNNDTDNQVTLYDESGSDANSNNVAQKQGAAINFTSAQTKLDELLKSGYVVDTKQKKSLTSSTFTPVNFDSNDTSDQTITVYLKHASATLQAGATNNTVTSDGKTVSMTSQINPDSSTNTLTWSSLKSDADLIDLSSDASAYQSLTRKATQTINYLFQDSKQKAYDSSVSQKTLTRTVTVDRVTGKMSISSFASVTFDGVNSPVVNNYHYVISKDAKVAGYTVSDTVADGKDSYTASNSDGDSQATLTPVYTVYYETDGKWRKVNEPVYASDGSLTSNTGTVDVGSYVTSDTDPSVVTITIPAHQGYTAKLDIGNDGTTDTTWDWKGSAEKTPANEVYQFDTSLANKDSTVTYSPDAQTLRYKVIDIEESDPKKNNVTALSKSVLTKDSDDTLATGVSDQKISSGKLIASYTGVDKELETLEYYYHTLGYVIESVDTIPTTFDHDDSVDQVVTIKVIHNRTNLTGPITPDQTKITDISGEEVDLPNVVKNNPTYSNSDSYTNKATVQRIISYVFDGNSTSAPQVDQQVEQTICFKQSVSYQVDLVTGAIVKTTYSDPIFDMYGYSGTTATNAVSDGNEIKYFGAEQLDSPEVPGANGYFTKAGWYEDWRDNADSTRIEPVVEKSNKLVNSTINGEIHYLKYQTAVIKIVDDNTNDKMTLQKGVLTSDSSDKGELFVQNITLADEKKQGDDVDFSSANTLLADLLNSGFKFEKSDVGTASGFNEAKYDSDDDTTQEFTIYLVHDTITLDGQETGANGPQTEGSSINTGKAANAKYPSEATSDYLTKAASQTIKFDVPGGKAPADDVQTQTLTRTATFDKATGKLKSTGDWRIKSFTALKAYPVVPGYHVTGVDAKKTTDQSSQTVSTAGGYTPTETDPTIVYTVHYEPNGSVIGENEPGGNTKVQYTTKDGDAKAVTGQVNLYPGYTATITTKSGTKTFDPVEKQTTETITPEDAGKDTTVTYTANFQQAVVKLIDDDDKTKTVTFTIDGYTGEAIKFTDANAGLKKMLSQGYILSASGNTDLATDLQSFAKQNFDATNNLQNSDAVIQYFEAHLKHDTAKLTGVPIAGSNTNADKLVPETTPIVDQLKNKASYTDASSVKRTVNYVFAGDSTNKPSIAYVVQTVTYTRPVTYTIDLVEGTILNVSYGDYSFSSNVSTTTKRTARADGTIVSEPKSLGKDAIVPAVSGDFTAIGWYLDPKSATANATELKQGSKDQEVHLTYLKYQKAIVQIIDEDSKDTNKAIYYDGQTNAQKEQGSNVDFKVANTKLQYLLIHGYIFATDKTSTGDQFGFTKATLDDKDDSDQTFTIYLKHDMAVITSRPTIGGKVTDEDGKQVDYNPETDNLADKSFTDKTTASRTVSYVFDGDSTDKPQKADLVQKSNFERPVSYKVDLATGDILDGPTYGEWTSKDDKISAAPTDVAGWYLTSSTNAGDMTLVPGQKVEGSLHYSKIQQAVVQVIDDTINTVLNSKDLTGEQGKAIDFNEANGWLKDYLASGYVLVSGKSDVTDDAFTPATFDALDNSNQSFAAHLIHRIAIVSGVPTVGESDNVHDENNQPVIYTPKEIDTKLQNASNFSENATATRKVRYVFEGNSTAKPAVDTVVQTINFNRNKSYWVDMVTGEIKDDPIYGAWTFVSGSTGNTSAISSKDGESVDVSGSGNLKSAEVPAVTGSFAGWYQTSANVDAKTLATGDDLTVDLTYKHYQNAKIQVIDDDESDPDKKMLFDTTTTGKQDTSVDLTNAEQKIATYLQQGYVLKTDFASSAFDKDDLTDQVFQAHLIHQKVTVNSLPKAGKSFKDVNGTDYDYPTTTAVKIPDVFTNEATVKRTISHKFETTNPDEQVPAASDIVQTVIYQRGITYTIDLVTGDYTTNLGVWTVKVNSTETGGVPDEQVPVVSGVDFDGWYRYEADDQNIGQTSLLLDDQGRKIDQTGVLAYKKYQKAIVQIFDQTKNKLLFVDAKSNEAKKQGADVDFTLANQELASLLKAGYALVDGQTIVSGTAFVPAKMDSDDTVDEVFTVYLQHTYTKSTEDIQITRTINYHQPDGKVDTITQPVILSRKVTTDNVDQTKDYGSWTTGTWDEKITPAIPGYKAVQPKVDKVAVTVNTPYQTVDVYYVADTQQVTVNIIDDKTGNTLFTTSLSGKTDQAVDFASVNKELAGKLASGYALAKDNNQALENSEFKPTNYLPDDTRILEAHLVHTYSEQTEPKTITRTINYHKPDGTIETVKQPVKLTRVVTTDNVDQTQTFGKWTSGQWDEAISPLVPGYKASQASVGQVAVDEHSQDQTIDIVYTANGQTAKVKIFDDNTGAKIQEMDLPGKSDQMIDFKPANDQLQAYLNQGYALAEKGNGDLSNGSFIPVKFDNDDAATQEFVAHLVHTYAKSTEDKTVTRTINYHKPDGSVVTVTQPVKLTRDVTTDKVTKVPSYGEWTSGQWDAKDTPVIAGYTPSESSVGQVLVNGDSQDTTINISYTANDQKAIVKIFDKTIGKDIYLENLLGTTDGKISFKNADDQLAVFLTKGYALADGNSDLTDGQFTPSRFDNVDNVDQVFTAILVHTYSKDSEKKTVTRTINYHKPDGKVETVTQPVELTRVVTIDKVDQSKTFGTWTKGQWNEKTTPVIAGYTASLDSVGQVTVDGDSLNQVVDIIYTAKGQKAMVKIYDDTTKQLLRGEGLAGQSDQAIDFTEADQQLASYLAKGFALAETGNDDLADGKFIAANYDNDDAVDQDFVAHLVHTYSKDSEKKITTRTINYHKPDGVETVTQPVELTRIVTTDNVDQSKSFDPWTNGQWGEKATPEVAGYTASQNSVAETPVDGATQDQVVDVFYSANGQSAVVKIYDDTTGQLLRQAGLTGKTGQAVDFNEANQQLTSYLAGGYALAEVGNDDLTNGQFTPANFDNAGEATQEFVAHLVHTYAKTSETKTVTRTINYHKPDGKVETVTQPVELTRVVTTDNVDQSKTFDPWTSGQWNVKSTPEIAGYTASQDSVAETPVDGSTQNQVVDVFYSANGQSAVVKIYDDTTGKLLSTASLAGKTGETIDFSQPNASLKDLLAKGYALAESGNSDLTNGQFTSAKFDNSDEATQEFVAHLVHTYAKSSETKTVTRTINYHKPDSKVETVTQPVQLTRVVTTDNVDQCKTFASWTSSQWNAKSTPEVAGYTASQNSVAETPVDGSTQNQVVDVYYSANGQSAVVKIYDDTTGKLLSTASLAGKTGETIDFSQPNASLKDLLAKGYALAEAGNSDLTNGQFTSANFDNADGATQEFIAHLVHTYSKTNEAKTVTRTINYHKPNGVETVTQPVQLTRVVTTDNVDQSKNFASWTSGEWSEKATPEVAGYTASQKTVAQSPVDGSTQDQVVDIYYTGESQKALVKIYDDTTGQLLSTASLAGKTGETIDFNFADASLLNYVRMGYLFAASGNRDLSGEKFAYALFLDAPAQLFEAHLVHSYAKSDEKQTITRTINYHLPSGTEAVEQTAELTRPVTTDLVTGQTSYGDWTRSEFTSQKTPELSNYTPSTSLITSQEVTHGDADSQENVYYYPNKQKATISFVDLKTGKTIKLMADFDSGKPNDAINFSQAKAQLAKLLKEGYKETGDLESIWKAVFASTDGENNFVIRLVPSLDMHPSVAPGKQATKPKTTEKDKEAGQKPSVPATGQTAGKGQQAASPAGQTAKTQSAELPQTGEASGKQLSWLGLLLAVVGTALSGIWHKKRDDE